MEAGAQEAADGRQSHSPSMSTTRSERARSPRTRRGRTRSPRTWMPERQRGGGGDCCRGALSSLPPSLGRGCSLARLRSPLYRWAISLTVLSVRLSLSSSFSLTLRFGRRRGSKKAAHSETTARRSMLAARTSRSRLRLRALAAFFGPSASALFYPSGPPSFDTYSTIRPLLLSAY